MTWGVTVQGHHEDRSKEVEIAAIVKEALEPVLPRLKDYGLTVASFYGNEHQEDFLASQQTEVNQQEA